MSILHKIHLPIPQNENLYRLYYTSTDRTYINRSVSVPEHDISMTVDTWYMYRLPTLHRCKTKKITMLDKTSIM